MSGPDPGSLSPVEAGAVPAVLAFEPANAPFAAGSPFHGASECPPVFGGLPGPAGFALTGDDDSAYPEVVQCVVDALLAVAPVGGDGARTPAGAVDDPLDRRGQLGGVGRVARLHAVVHNDPIVVVDDLAL